MDPPDPPPAGPGSGGVDPDWPPVTAIVDTNVVAYYLLGTEPFVDEVRRFWQTVDEAWAPVHWEAEFANAIWMAVRTGALPREEGHRKLDMASRLGVQPVAIRPLWQPALTRALQSGVAVYDTLFVELAAQRDLRLATFDGDLLRKFPEIARRPRALSSI
jgi:predicted nucleic acid-binding protein